MTLGDQVAGHVGAQVADPLPIVEIGDADAAVAVVGQRADAVTPSTGASRRSSSPGEAWSGRSRGQRQDRESSVVTSSVGDGGC